jgi:hypothetical protein
MKFTVRRYEGYLKLWNYYVVINFKLFDLHLNQSIVWPSCHRHRFAVKRKFLAIE